MILCLRVYLVSRVPEMESEYQEISFLTSFLA